MSRSLQMRLSSPEALHFLFKQSIVGLCTQKVLLSSSRELSRFFSLTATQEDLAAGQRDEALMQGLVGTVSLLGRISRNPSHAAQVYEAGGLTAIAAALSHVTDCVPSGDAFSACCSALAALSNVEEYATELYTSYSITSTVLTTLYNNANVECVQESALELLAAIAQHETIRPPLIDESAVEIISYSMQYAPQNFTAQVITHLS